MKPLIVFDIDDTLYLERDYVRSGFNAVDRWAQTEFRLNGVGAAAWRLFLNGRRNTTIADAFAVLGRSLTRTELANAVSVYRHHTPTIDLCPDALDLLESLAGRANLAIVTDGPAVSQRAKIRALRLGQYTDSVIVTAEHGAAWHKPSQKAFSYLQEENGTKGKNCCYIGDNPAKDFIGPKTLGWHTVRVRRELGLHCEQTSNNSEVDCQIRSLRYLDRRLLAHGSTVAIR